jgi:aminopeptidase N
LKNEVEELWETISKLHNFKSEQLRNDFSLIEFEETDLIPTYAFLLCAGKFLVIQELLTEEIEKS